MGMFIFIAVMVGLFFVVRDELRSERVIVRSYNERRGCKSETKKCRIRG